MNAAQSTTTITAPAGFKYPKPTPGYGKRSELEERTFGWLFGNRGGNRGGNNWGNRRPNRFSPNPFWMKFMQNGKGGRCYRESPKKYPKAVVCRNDIAIIVPKIVNVAGDLVTETACQPTSWITETETATSTLPVANAVTTITTTTSVTCTTNIKITTTVPCVKTRTQTNSPPQATYYEQCGTKNQVTRDSNGNRIALYSEAGADFNPTQDADSAYDCCVACIMTNQAALKDSSAQSYCAGSNYVDSPNDSVQTCQLNLYSTCANPVTQSRIAMNYYSSDIGVDVTVSNGPAGYYQYVDSSGKPL